jgi:hypothetical protein
MACGDVVLVGLVGVLVDAMDGTAGGLVDVFERFVPSESFGSATSH